MQHPCQALNSQGCEQIPPCCRATGDCSEPSPQREHADTPLGQHLGPWAKESAKFLGNFWELLTKSSSASKQHALLRAQAEQQWRLQSSQMSPHAWKMGLCVTHGVRCWMWLDDTTFLHPFLPYLLWPSTVLPKCPAVPHSWLRLALGATGTGSLFSPVCSSLSPSSKVLSRRQGFFFPCQRKRA